MAVIEELKLEANVQINGNTAPEFNDPEPPADDDDNHRHPLRCSKYIECVSDAEFSVRFGLTSDYDWMKTQPNYGLTFHVHVDGKWMSGSICQQKRVIGGVWSHDVQGYVDCAEGAPFARLHKFKFAAVNKVDDADKGRVKKDAQRAKHLGEIEVLVRRVIVGDDIKDASKNRDQQNGELSIAEKALKGRALSHATSFAPPVPHMRSRATHCDGFDDKPLAIFTFKYRSRDALKEEMVIPRSPSPELRLNGLGSEEITRLAQERLKQIKHEKTLKRQRSTKREPGEVYDLTGDSLPSRPFKVSKRDDGIDLVDLTED